MANLPNLVKYRRVLWARSNPLLFLQNQVQQFLFQGIICSWQEYCEKYKTHSLYRFFLSFLTKENQDISPSTTDTPMSKFLIT